MTSRALTNYRRERLMALLDLLDQDVFWISSDGRRYDLAEMHPEHRGNLLEKLRRDVDGVVTRCNDELERRGEPRWTGEPIDELERQPLVRALVTYQALESLDQLHDCDADCHAYCADDRYQLARTLLARKIRRNDESRRRLGA